MTPIMYKIEVDGKPYMDPVKKFTVSKDCVFAGLVTSSNTILICRVSISSSIFSKLLILICLSFIYSCLTLMQMVSQYSCLKRSLPRNAKLLNILPCTKMLLISSSFKTQPSDLEMDSTRYIFAAKTESSCMKALTREMHIIFITRWSVMTCSTVSWLQAHLIVILAVKSSSTCFKQATTHIRLDRLSRQRTLRSITLPSTVPKRSSNSLITM